MRRSIVFRTAQIGLATLSAGFVFGRERLRLGRKPGALAAALGRGLVHAATRLGATFIKVGQIASTRADLLPAALCDELAQLRDRVPPEPFDRVRATIEADFGRPLAELFPEFDPRPVAAASVAQVHRARLPDGTVAAVKVRRPDILRTVRMDRTLLLLGARVAERLVPSLRLIALEGAVRDFCNAVEAQLHLAQEAKNARRFAEQFADDPDIRFPAPYEALCTDAVLTMEFVEGVREDELEARGVEVHRVVEAGMRAVSRMIFLHGFVHADLHPGNLRFEAPGRIVFLDLGLVGELEDTDRISTARLLFAFATGDGGTVAKLLHDHAPWRATPDYPAYEREVVAFVDDVRRRGLGNLHVTGEIARIFDILRRHRIMARSHMTMVNLAMMTAEGLGKRLAPELSLTEAAIPYLAEALGVPPPRPT